MENPFEIILARLDHIENLIKELKTNHTSHVHAPVSEIMNLPQAAEYLSLSKSSLYKSTSQREIPHFKKGKKIYFKKSELDLWLTQIRVKTKIEIETEANTYLAKGHRKRPSRL
jgi:excisionase family DNA binding protein